MRRLYIDFDGVVMDTIPLLYNELEKNGVAGGAGAKAFGDDSIGSDLYGTGGGGTFGGSTDYGNFQYNAGGNGYQGVVIIRNKR